MGGHAGLRLLLDTHIWLWSLREPSLLGVRVQRELQDSANEFWISPISVWEAFILKRKGRIVIQGDLADWLADATIRLREAPLTRDIVLASEQLPLGHQDPADRFLAATAYVLDLTLVTADAHLLGLGEISTLANR
jgi:PIN domain nuclease of toxin-antitoxin system